MMRRLMIGAISAAACTLSTATFAQQGQFGTAQEARAMLDKAVAAVIANKDAALAMFNKGENGFLDRDLYPFCSNASDGKFVAVGPNVKHCLGLISGPLKTLPARCTARNFTPRRRSRPVKSLKSVTCLRGRALTTRCFRR